VLLHECSQNARVDDLPCRLTSYAQHWDTAIVDNRNIDRVCRHLNMAMTACANSTAQNAPCLGEYGLALDENCATAFAPILGVPMDKLQDLSKAHRQLNLECLLQEDQVCAMQGQKGF
jgi:hypothetical protein